MLLIIRLSIHLVTGLYVLRIESYLSCLVSYLIRLLSTINNFSMKFCSGEYGLIHNPSLATSISHSPISLALCGFELSKRNTMLPAYHRLFLIASDKVSWRNILKVAARIASSRIT